MTVILAEVYDALRSIPGMDEGKARRAAEALGASDGRTSAQDHRLDRIEARLETLDKRVEGLERKVDRIEADVAALKTDVTLLKWMVGFVLGGMVIALGKLLTL